MRDLHSFGLTEKTKDGTQPGILVGQRMTKNDGANGASFGGAQLHFCF